MSIVSQFNPFSPETIECPYPFYAAMRREAPVYEAPVWGSTLLAGMKTCSLF